MFKILLQSLEQCLNIGGYVIEFDLPEEIIQRIQSFLNGKEAARSTLLSKSWRRAWSTRPNLDFDARGVSNLQTVQQFLKSAMKTTQRYEDLNLNIETFRLHLTSALGGEREKELIVKAVKLGAFDLDLFIWNQNFVLPDSVLRSETLARLSLSGNFTFDFKHLVYSKLKSLSLSYVDVEGLSDSCDEFRYLEYMYLCSFSTKASLFNDASFLSRFSALKELVLVNCLNLGDTITIRSRSVERITITSNYDDRMLSVEFDVPNIRRFEFEGRRWPRLAFKKPTCREWESDIRVECYATDVDWFINLSKILTELSMSTVSLYMYVYGEKEKLSKWLIGDAAPRVVNKLTLKGWGLNATFLDNLFLICRPKLITGEEYSLWRERIEKYLFELVCKGRVEQVNVEVLETASHEWRCVPLCDHAKVSRRVLSKNALKSFHYKTFRYQLRWGMECRHSYIL